MTGHKPQNVERVEIEANLILADKAEPSKLMQKIYDAFTESKIADYETEFRQEGQITLHIREKELERIHISMIEDFCHFAFHMEENITESWVNVASSILDKLVLLFDTFGFKLKEIEVEGNFEIQGVSIEYENFIVDKELVGLVNKINMPLTPLSTAFLSKHGELDIVLILPKRESKDKEKQAPGTIILHNDYDRHEIGILAKLYGAARTIEEHLKPLKEGEKN